MGNSPSNDLHNVPFGIQVPSSLYDPKKSTFSIEQLGHLNTIDDARNIALKYLHDPVTFASFWNSYTHHSQTRIYLMRKLIQIQTINAVFNRFERILR
jgi:hypothetical protein